MSWGFRAAAGAAGKLELQASVAGKLSVPAVVTDTVSHDQPAASLLALLVLRQCGAWLKVTATIQG